MRYATHPHDFKLLVSSDGQRSTSIEQRASRDSRHQRRLAGYRGRRRRPRAAHPDLPAEARWRAQHEAAGPSAAEAGVEALRLADAGDARRQAGQGADDRRRSAPSSTTTSSSARLRPAPANEPSSDLEQHVLERLGLGRAHHQRPAAGSQAARHAGHERRAQPPAAPPLGHQPDADPAPGADPPRGAAAHQQRLAHAAAHAQPRADVGHGEPPEVALEQLDRPLEVERRARRCRSTCCRSRTAPRASRTRIFRHMEVVTRVGALRSTRSVAWREGQPAHRGDVAGPVERALVGHLGLDAGARGRSARARSPPAGWWRGGGADPAGDRRQRRRSPACRRRARGWPACRRRTPAPRRGLAITEYT